MAVKPQVRQKRATGVAVDTASEAHEVFEVAESFRIAVNIMNAKIHACRDLPLIHKVMTPVTVCASLTIELYMKTLLTLQNGTYLHEHDLAKLFRNLSRESKAKLRKRHRELAGEDFGLQSLPAPPTFTPHWRDSDPQFAKAWEEALEMSVDRLVMAAFQRALKSSDTLLTFLLRAHRGAIYNISSRVEQIGEPADDKKVSLRIYYNNGDQPLSTLLDFPVHPSMAVGYDAWKKAEEKQRLAEESEATEKAAEEIEDEEKISDAPPSKVVNKALTGRIRPEWKGNGK
jgi:hypothetical protein